MENLKKEVKFLACMDKKLYAQLRAYSYHNNQSLAKTARQALKQFLKEKDL